MEARLGLFLKNERDRVDAPALIRWDVEALALKDVTQVRITFGTADLGSDAWGERAIFNESHCAIRSWRVERRPTAAGMKLCLRAKEFVAPCLAAIAADSFSIGVFTSKWSFSCTFTEHCIRKRI